MVHAIGFIGLFHIRSAFQSWIRYRMYLLRAAIRFWRLSWIIWCLQSIVYLHSKIKAVCICTIVKSFNHFVVLLEKASPFDLARKHAQVTLASITDLQTTFLGNRVTSEACRESRECEKRLLKSFRSCAVFLEILWDTSTKPLECQKALVYCTCITSKIVLYDCTFFLFTQHSCRLKFNWFFLVDHDYQPQMEIRHSNQPVGLRSLLVLMSSQSNQVWLCGMIMFALVLS